MNIVNIKNFQLNFHNYQLYYIIITHWSWIFIMSSHEFSNMFLVNIPVHYRVLLLLHMNIHHVISWIFNMFLVNNIQVHYRVPLFVLHYISGMNSHHDIISWIFKYSGYISTNQLITLAAALYTHFQIFHNFTNIFIQSTQKNIHIYHWP